MNSRNDPGTNLSRRTFLHSLGALALSACGGGESSPASTAVSRASARDASSTITLSHVANGATDISISGAFVHPGLLHTQADFDRMAQKVAAQASPWYDGWQVLIANGYTNLSRSPRPQVEVDRGGSGPQNYPLLYADIAAAYGCALRWKISGDTVYADKAVQIMNAWSSTLQRLGGDSNVDLAAGIYGYEFANAGEIMRSYPGWAAADFAAFQSMMINIFYPINVDFLNRHNNTDITHYWANWDLCNMASIMAIGVLCDDHRLFDQAANYFIDGAGNGAIAQAVYYLHPGYLGQWQETGRDQGHNTLGIALGGAICEMAWNQGIDLYGYDNNRFLAGAEYVAKANLVQPDGTFLTVPYVTYTNVDVTQPGFSTASQGTIRPCWALVYNHYVNRKGLAAPWSTKFAQAIQPEGGGGNYGTASGGFDQLGYGTLTCTRDAVTPAAAPTGLTAYPSAGQVVLSWWGVANSTSYNVKRAAASGGPYTTIASSITDPLTYTDSPSSGTWYYVVSAQTSTGETANSAEAAAVTAVQLHTCLTFDEASGTNAADATGNAHTGTLVGGASRVTGKVANAVSLDGSTGYVSLANNIVADVSDFTIAAWVNWSGGNAWARIFDFGAGTGRYLFLTPKSSAGIMCFSITTNGGYGSRNVNGNTALPTGQWAHVAVTLSGTTATLYLNGNAIGSATDVIFAPWRVGPTAQNWIGRSQYPADPFFKGAIDEFRIYRNALSADQITALVQAA
ncbi:LamG domain protein jellyroll fold domain protein [Paraburkholderia ribeironis]|uniref:LamG domain protein jellyroll fold domain protein n=1 Tax=Paraburkholderia ribeironis TaxID=1247936 RepID=A0A1N7SGC2_9BURK|nr:LamG-like jellyroll fold domain-containing protein [Paraburkholderia ribeironis]SIT46446.1 LamG domain protein jellyroll fold domain protein [Paraburkholderia ribeironis]